MEASFPLRVEVGYLWVEVGRLKAEPAPLRVEGDHPRAGT